MATKFNLIISQLLLILTLASCYHENKADVEKPGKFLPQEEMAAVLADVQIAEGALNYNRVRRIGSKDMEDKFYAQVFTKYDISASDFKKNLDYYNSKPKLMEKTLDMVEDIINRKVEKVKQDIAEEKVADSISRAKVIADSLNLSDSLSAHH